VSIPSDRRDIWQDECVNALLDSPFDKQFFLASVAPACGKTRMALKYARICLDDNIYDKLIVVSPQVNVRQQWIDSATPLGVNLATGGSELGPKLKRYHGASLTYQAVASQLPLLQKLCADNRVLVVLDEPHHAGTDSTWGADLLEAFSGAERIVGLTGTPWRTDGTSIPWCTYDINGQLVTDYLLSYRTAVENNFVRPMFFDIYNGSGVISRHGEQVTLDSRSVMSEDQHRDLMRALCKSDGDYLWDVLDKAAERLDNMRQFEMPNAAMLVLCDDQFDARSVARRLIQIHGKQNVELVISDDATAQEKIRRLRTSHTRFIVSVRMISEGVDIPRIGVIVWAATQMTELFLHQVMGRATRMTEHKVTPTMFVPMVEPLYGFVRQVQNDVMVALEERDRNEQRQVCLDGLRAPIRSTMEVIGSQSEGLTEVVALGTSISADEIEPVRELADQHNISGHPAQILMMIDAWKNREATLPALTGSKTVTLENQEDLERRLRSELQNKVNKLAHLFVTDDYDLGTAITGLNADLKRKWGPRGAMSCDVLQRAIDYINARIQNGG
jgi:superfamily II DNA or RNA helicase